MPSLWRYVVLFGLLPGLTRPAPALAQVPICPEEFSQRVESLATSGADASGLVLLFRSNLPGAQQLLRQRFRAFARQRGDGVSPQTADRHGDLSRLVQTWHAAFPHIPLLIPWPEALRWNDRQAGAFLHAADQSARAERLYHQGDFVGAQRIWRQAFSSFQRLGARHATSTLWMNLGLCEYELGRLDTAWRYLSEALAIKEEYADDRGRRDCMMNLSLVAELQGRYTRSKALLDQAHQINTTLCDPATEARILSSLGVLANETGRLRAAEENYRRSLEIRQRIGDAEGEATDISNLGVLLRYRGLIPDALKAFQQSLDIRRVIGDREGEADSLLNLSMVYADMGQTALSTEYFFESLRIYESVNSPNRMVSAWSQAGELYLQMGHSRQAETYFRAGLELAERHSFSADIASLKSRVALASSLRGQHEQAISWLQDALAIYGEIGDEPASGTVMLDLGRVLLQQGQIKSAVHWLLQSYALAEQWGLVTNLAEIALELGRLALDRGKAVIAASYFQRAARLSAEAESADFAWRAFEGFSKAEELMGRLPTARRHLQQAISRVLEMESEIPLASLALHFWDDKADLFRRMSRYEESKGNLQAAWAWTDFGKARFLRAKTVDGRNPWENSPSERSNDRAQETTNTLQRLMRGLAFAEDSEPTRLAELQLQIEELRMQETDAGHGRFPPAPHDWPQGDLLTYVRSRLGDDEVLVDFVFQTDGVWAWVVDSSDFSLVRLDITANQLAYLMQQAGLWTGELPTYQPPEKTPHIDSRIVEEISRVLWHPIDTRLTPKIRSVVIVPDGVLHLLPFEILPIPSRRGNPLLDRYAISYLHAASLIDGTAMLPPKDSLGIVALAPLSPADSSPHIGREVESLPGLFPTAEIFYGLESGRRRFAATASKAHVLHMAAHYKLNTQRPAFSRLEFRSDAPHTETFFSFDAAVMGLKPELAVLSACNTAWGVLQPGEGLINLGRAFLVNGSQSVILSMWPVEEGSTEYLMRAFYRYLAQGLDSRESLRRAKQKVRQDPRWRHPFFWGAFVLTGSPVRIDSSAPLDQLQAERARLAGMFALGVLLCGVLCWLLRRAF